MAYMPIAQKTPWQQGRGVDVDSTALLVVDVLGGDSGLPAGFENEAGNCVKLVETARRSNVFVVFACDAHRPPYDRELELWGDHGIVGTPGSRPLDEFGNYKADIIIEKRRYDAFFCTDLDITLRELGIDTLVVCGTDANICVLHTLAGAFFRGYKTIVASDAVWTFLVGTHQGALEYFSTCFDSRVVTTDTIVSEYFRAARRDCPA